MLAVGPAVTVEFLYQFGITPRRNASIKWDNEPGLTRREQVERISQEVGQRLVDEAMRVRPKMHSLEARGVARAALKKLGLNPEVIEFESVVWEAMRQAGQILPDLEKSLGNNWSPDEYDEKAVALGLADHLCDWLFEQGEDEWSIEYIMFEALVLRGYDRDELARWMREREGGVR